MLFIFYSFSVDIFALPRATNISSVYVKHWLRRTEHEIDK